MKIICVGRNYAAHAKELNNPVNEDPVIFLKPETARPIGRLPFFYPDFSKDIHYEVELVLKINRAGKKIQEKFAHKYFDELGIGIDFTARDIQSQLKKKGLPWEIAKGFDGSAPYGGFTSIKDLPKLDNIDFSLVKNGDVVQKGNTGNMIFSFSRIIAYVSQFMTLKKGDVIFTGTPEGVGPVEIGDDLKAFIGDKELLKVKVK